MIFAHKRLFSYKFNAGYITIQNIIYDDAAVCIFVRVCLCVCMYVCMLDVNICVREINVIRPIH